MCGIAGSWRAPEQVADALPAALACIRHRGPDDMGSIRLGDAALGMTRLAVIDPVDGRQPMTAAEGKVAIVFNGEIYNYKELRQGLQGSGHRFLTNSDTEVVLAAYLRKGLRFVDDLVGMFAVAIADSRSDELVLARDRFGKKPLYYAGLPEGGLTFASELKGLAPMLAAAGLDRRVRPQSVYDYLSLGVVPQPATIWEGVLTLEPGTVMVTDRAGRSRTTSYWSPVIEGVAQQGSAEPLGDPGKRVRELIAEATRIRLRSDVPLGIFLSGGVDSSVVGYEAARALGGELQAFTVKTSGELDESDVAARTAATLGIRHTVLPLTLDPVAGVQQVVRAYDQPFADSSAIPSLAISALAREHVTVVLNGDGGDEVFGGYRRHLAAHLMVPRARLVGGAAGLMQSLVPRSVARRGPLGLALRVARGLRLPADERYLAWTTDMLREGDKTAIWRGRHCEPTERLVAATRVPWLSALDQQLLSDIRINLLSDLLVKMDIASMAHSLEARSPLLDHRLADYVWSLPPKVRLPKRTPKGLLRESYRGLLSSEVLDGAKRGFEIPMSDWLAGGLRPMVQDLVLAPDARVLDFIDRDAVVELVDGTGYADRNLTYLRYGLLVLEMWLRDSNAA
ncbi:asparagine synthetase B [Nocardioides flavus (ex Wang et al. 2016)]|uniref:asparagine synthase (glutamine-hydrolyzing) n=1 Tax=Nocardioides flavus (ex Wang et al. 2016) TaxID=2058780 RepID=A0ABQ3HFQ0_9ACTN|nr:asparagine synthase (glutamine-hydrolyzing) [Nocardioides flavus (ex Wang et al. 2016)]GHE14964.1 asparagine synthetase B [Nocardioides flavus (ex Wang et al. 2016)]